MAYVGRNRLHVGLTLLLLAGQAPAGAALDRIELGLPLACTLGKDCFIQQYIDVQPGPGAKDYRCGDATYDGHDGTDFRLLSLAATAGDGVPVLAAAPGRVMGARDGMDDRLTATPDDRALVEGRECGNGVRLDHGAGWETQYCHLRRGSVRVRGGDSVAAGTPLGRVGVSGSAAFAHVHLTVRQDGKPVDPFLGAPAGGACLPADAPLASSLWAPAIRAQLAYRDAAIIETGFAAGPVLPEQAETGGIAPPEASSPALVFYARAINLRQGDSLRIKAEGPGGYAAGNEAEPLPRAQAHYVGFTGKKRTGDRWPAGLYQGQVAVIRQGAVVGEAKAAFHLP
jgi:Peptidase family M23